MGRPRPERFSLEEDDGPGEDGEKNEDHEDHLDDDAGVADEF
jgi:hypothetical protein